MSHATPYRNHQTRTRKRSKAATIVSKDSLIQHLDAAPKRRGRDKEGQTPVCTGGCSPNGFLRTRFLPLFEKYPTAYSYGNPTNVEQDFYTSLSQLAEQYHLQLELTQQYGYPYNIAMGLAEVQRQLRKKTMDWQEIHLVQHEGSTFFAKEQRYNTGSKLYYIPIAPLYIMLKDKKRKTAGQLLLSVCCYLYRIADIPYYRQEGTYLYYMYEMLTDWMQEEGEEPESELMKEQKCAENIGDIMEAKLRNPANLACFEQRLKNFKVTDELDQDCASLADAAFRIYQQYPTIAIDRNIPYYECEDSQEDSYRVSLDKYISFYATGKGALSDSLLDNINVDLQEYVCIDEPLIYAPIDGRVIEGNNLDFEKELFTLLGDIATVLYSYEHHDYENNHQ